MIKEIIELQAIAQSGLAYCKDHFDIERFNRILEIAANLLAENSNHQYKNVLELFTKESGYATPKVGVRAAVFKDDKILLAQEKDDGLWALPGGWCDVGLSPCENIVKEIKEETGYESEVIKLIAVVDMSKKGEARWPHVYTLVFLCHIVSERQLPFDKREIANVGFFACNSIPELSKSRTSSAEIELCFKHYHNQSLPVAFD
jgi:ADP-ribose pyrophosphatase YjhB (NUDIX family)